MTPARKTALRKAQRAAAIKRHQRAKRNKKIAVGAGIGVGVLAGVGAGYVLGTKTKTGAPAAANARNRAARFVSTAHKEAVRMAGAISPPRVAARFRRAKPTKPGNANPQVFRRVEIPAVHPDVRDAMQKAAESKNRPGKDPITGLPLKPMNPAYKAPRVRGGKISETAAKKAVAKDQAQKIAMGVEHGHLTGTQKRVDNMIADGTVRKVYAGRKTRSKTRRPRKAAGGGISAEQRLRNAAFDQFLKDFGD
jgi:hypothetical protein